MSDPNPVLPTAGPPRLFPGPFQEELDQLRDNWFWILLLGIALVVLGAFAILYAFVASVATAVVFGVLFFVGGVLQIIGAFRARGWGSFFLELLIGILYLVAGGLMIRHPVITLQAITLVLGAFILVGGIFRAVGAVGLRFRNWGWVLLSGVLSIILGTIILAGWPWTSVWVLGVFVGIDMIFSGSEWITLALVVRGLPGAGLPAGGGRTPTPV